MSDTPRTDAVVNRHAFTDEKLEEYRELARQLERELAAANERIKELQEKALKYDLDSAGIERRNQEAVELVECRARIASLEERLEIWATDDKGNRVRDDDHDGIYCRDVTIRMQDERIQYLQKVASKVNDDVCQSLGKALGYPWFKDDQKNFPGTTEDDGVCYGDHVAESIAEEAASRIAELERELDALRGTRNLLAFEDIRKRANELYASFGADELAYRVADLERGEFICKKCGLRKDNEFEQGDF